MSRKYSFSVIGVPRKFKELSSVPRCKKGWEPLGYGVSFGYRGRRFKQSLHQDVVSLSKTLNLHCISGLSCYMCTRRDLPCGECLFSAMSTPKEKALKINVFLYYSFCSNYIIN